MPVYNHIPKIEDDMQGATETEAGKAGLVPTPAAGQSDRYLASDGTWHLLFEIFSLTLSSASWANEDGGYTYTIENSKILSGDEENLVELIPAHSTEEYYSKLSELSITKVLQSEGKLIFYSATKPTSDIEILLYIYEKRTIKTTEQKMIGIETNGRIYDKTRA